jgi:DNA-binding NtrC family response regulator
VKIQDLKLRFGIIGNSPQLDHCIDIARQVAPTDLSVLITGESGTGKTFLLNRYVRNSLPTVPISATELLIIVTSLLLHNAVSF